jgi:WD40 repeat protein
MPEPPAIHEPAAFSVTKDPNGLVHLWRAEPGGIKEAADPLPHPAEVVSISIDSTSRYLATICRDKTLRIWEIATGLLVTPPLPLSSSDGRIVWEDSRHMIAVWTDHDAVLFDW